MEHIHLEVEGLAFSAAYDVFDDELIVHFPDGTSDSTMLRGLRPRLSAEVCLRSYANQKIKNRCTETAVRLF